MTDDQFQQLTARLDRLEHKLDAILGLPAEAPVARDETMSALPGGGVYVRTHAPVPAAWKALLARAGDRLK